MRPLRAMSLCTDGAVRTVVASRCSIIEVFKILLLEVSHGMPFKNIFTAILKLKMAIRFHVGRDGHQASYECI